LPKGAIFWDNEYPVFTRGAEGRGTASGAAISGMGILPGPTIEAALRAFKVKALA
jgi:hypothetical protein